MQFSLDGSSVNILIAFFAGVSAFFASCFLPLLPIYLAYITGESVDEDAKSTSRRMLRLSVLFSFGFWITFVLTGLAIAQFAQSLAYYKMWLEMFGAAVILVLGFLLLGIFRLPLLDRDYHPWFKPFTEKAAPWKAFTLGVALALGWSPCIGPVLAVILFWAAQQDTFIHSLLLLSSFGAGLTMPFVAFGVSMHRLSVVTKNRIASLSSFLRLLAAAIMIGGGGSILLRQLLRLWGRL